MLIPVYNDQAALERTLASVDCHSCSFDIFVVDDGSEPAIAIDPARYRHALSTIRLEKNAGIERALNEGLSRIIAAGYEFVARQDAGDVDVAGRISRQAAFLDANPEIALIGTWTQFTDTSDRDLYVFRAPQTPPEVRRRLHYGAAVIHPSLMVRTSVLKRTGLYAFNFPQAEDYELVARIASAYPCANLPEVLVRKVEEPTSLSNAKRSSSLKSRMGIQWKYFDWWSIHSYLGLLQSTLLYSLPYPMILKVKQHLGSVR